MPRRNVFQTFEAAKAAGPYDEFPVLTEGVDPQLHLSRNDRPQPFYLTCEKDNVLMQMSGASRVEMLNGSVRYFDLVPGDHVYVSAGIAHRILPSSPSIMYRYKAVEPALEAISFPCERCGELLLQETWNTADELPQAAYLRITETFNAVEATRTCSCAHVSPPIDLTGYRWAGIVEELTATETEEAW